ncbi:hypothetical protein, partial [Xanthomonas campestris]
AHAFKALFDFVVSMDATGAKDEEAPAFSYILTPKQVDEIDRVCDANQWQKSLLMESKSACQRFSMS